MDLSILTFNMATDKLFGMMNADKLCRSAKENGVNKLDLMDFEIRMYGLKNMQKALEKNKMKCACFVATISFFKDDETVSKEISAALDTAQKFSAPFLMIVPAQPFAGKKYGKLPKEQLRDILIKNFSLAVGLSKDYSIQICVEDTPMPWLPLASAEDCEFVLRHVGGLKLVYDTANMKTAGDDEIAFYERLKTYICHVHLKDAVFGDFRYGENCADGKKMAAVASGTGTVKIKEALELLKRDGYKGTAAIEYARSSFRPYHLQKHIAKIKEYCDYLTGVI